MAILNTYSPRYRTTTGTKTPDGNGSQSGSSNSKPEDLAADKISESTGLPVSGEQVKTAFNNTIFPMLKSIFQKGGVSSDFFSRFPFLAFLDNSTGSWKSRYSKQSGWTPNERIAWYIQLINEKGNSQDAIQYSELYGNAAKITGDRKYETDQIDYDLAVAFNATCLYTFFTDGNNLITSGKNTYNKDYILLDVRVTKNKSTSLVSPAIKMPAGDLGNPNNPDKQNEQGNQNEKTPVNEKIKDNKFSFIAGVGSILYGIFKLFL